MLAGQIARLVLAQNRNDLLVRNPLSLRVRPRLNRHSSHPEQSCGELEEAEEVCCSAVEAGGDAPEVLELGTRINLAWLVIS